MRLREIQSPTKQSPDQQRVKAMSDRAKNLQKQVKQERARQALTKAQERLRKANSAKID